MAEALQKIDMFSMEKRAFEHRIKRLEGDVLARDGIINDLRSQLETLTKEKHEMGKEMQKVEMEKNQLDRINRNAIVLSNALLQFQIK